MGEAADGAFDAYLRRCEDHWYSIHGQPDKVPAKDPDLPWNKPLRRWEVTDERGTEHKVTAHFCFNNDGEGLVFRRYHEGQSRTTIVAAFAQGFWVIFKEIHL